MSLNLFDVILLIIIAIAVIVGVIKGLVRLAIGITAVVLGFILAMNFFDPVGDVIGKVVHNPMLSKLLGFFAVFFGVVIIGGVVSWIVSKMMKGPVKFVNHILGAALGFLEGVLICGVIVLSQMIFPVGKDHLYKSELAPYCARLVKVVYGMIPKDLKDNFNETYDRIVRDNEGSKDERS